MRKSRTFATSLHRCAIRSAKPKAADSLLQPVAEFGVQRAAEEVAEPPEDVVHLSRCERRDLGGGLEVGDDQAEDPLRATWVPAISIDPKPRLEVLDSVSCLEFSGFNQVLAEALEERVLSVAAIGVRGRHDVLKEVLVELVDVKRHRRPLLGPRR